MPSEKKAEELLVRLMRATVDKDIEWAFKDAPPVLTIGTGDQVHSFMVTSFKGQTFGAYDRRYRSYDFEKDETYWSSQAMVVLLDGHGRVLWDSSDSPIAANQLFEKARESAGGVNDIFDKLLADD